MSECVRACARRPRDSVTGYCVYRRLLAFVCFRSPKSSGPTTSVERGRERKQSGFWLQRTKEKERKCLSSSSSRRRWTGCRAGARCSLWIPSTPMWSGWSTPSAVPSCSGPCSSRRSSERSVGVSEWERVSERVNAPPNPVAPFLRALRQRGVEREAPGEEGEVGCVANCHQEVTLSAFADCAGCGRQFRTTRGELGRTLVQQLARFPLLQNGPPLPRGLHPHTMQQKNSLLSSRHGMTGLPKQPVVMSHGALRPLWCHQPGSPFFPSPKLKLFDLDGRGLTTLCDATKGFWTSPWFVRTPPARFPPW